MKRTTVYIEEDQLKQIRDHYEKKGVKMASVIRFGIKLYFEKEKKWQKLEDKRGLNKD